MGSLPGYFEQGHRDRGAERQSKTWPNSSFTETAAVEPQPFRRFTSIFATSYGRGGSFGVGAGAELVTYAAVTSSLALCGSFSATGPFSVKSISMSVAGE